MLCQTGYYDHEYVEELTSETDFFVHCAGRYRLNQQDVFETKRPRGAKNYQLIYVIEGNVQFFIGDEATIVRKGGCFLYRPLEPQRYRYKKEDQTDICWVHFSCKEENEVWQKLIFKEGNTYEVGSSASCLRFYEEMIQELQIREVYFEEAAEYLLRQLLITMSRKIQKREQPPTYYNMQVEEAIRYFHKYSADTIVIREYTKERQLNYCRFIDSFAKYTGLAPKQYLIQIRIARAKELLENEMLRISDVASMTGYDNPLYFSRLFKQETGMSPKEFREG